MFKNCCVPLVGISLCPFSRKACAVPVIQPVSVAGRGKENAFLGDSVAYENIAFKIALLKILPRYTLPLR